MDQIKAVCAQASALFSKFADNLDLASGFEILSHYRDTF